MNELAYIDDVYIHVVNEDLSHNVEVSTHPVEQGVEITDTVKRGAASLSLSGNIVDYEVRGLQAKASNVIRLLKQKASTGKLVTYTGRNICGSFQITSFSTGHPNTIWGGCTFSMELQECRIAKNSYVAPKTTATDGQNQSSVKDGGQQQVDKGENGEVYYTTKNGDTVWNLVVRKSDGTIADYANLKREKCGNGDWDKCKWVMANNRHAFSKFGVYESLQVDQKLYLGNRE